MKKYLWIAFISMVPVIELRGAIPISQGMKLPLIYSYIVCIIANMVPVPFIYMFARKLLIWGSTKKIIGKPFSFCLNKGEKAGNKFKKSKSGAYVALALFVGIPLPGTGAWTGMLAASILKLDFKKSVISVMVGVLLAGIIMSLASFGVFNLIIK